MVFLISLEDIRFKMFTRDFLIPMCCIFSKSRELVFLLVAPRPVSWPDNFIFSSTHEASRGVITLLVSQWQSKIIDHGKDHMHLSV